MNSSVSLRARLMMLSGALGLALLLACGGRSHAPGEVEVYVAGFESSGIQMPGYIPNVAKLWKGGSTQNLTPPSAGGVATAIAVSGGDIHVAGHENFGTTDVVRHWKNGSPVSLTDGTREAWANAICLSGSDVYIGGGEEEEFIPVAKYWKNGVPVALTDGKHRATVFGLAVSGHDVYAAGFEYGDTLIAPNHRVLAPIAKYWKNGVPVALSDGTRLAVATSIVVSGGDVYVAGFEEAKMDPGTPFVPYIAKYWKNGVPVELTPGTQGGAVARSIALVGSDIYVAGFESNGSALVAKYWKNGSPVALTKGTRDAGAYSIAVFGTDVYVSGFEDSDKGMAAKYWKNGEGVALTDGTQDAMALALVVVQK